MKINLFDLKGKLLLTILGSYDASALVRLGILKAGLMQKGFTKCKLVSDYSIPKKTMRENNDQYFRKKSIYWLENSDACIFVFLHGCNNEGVAFELKHTCDHLESKLETCLVLIESKSTRNITSLLRGTISNLVDQQKINRRFFTDDAQALAFCGSQALSFLRKKRYFLIERA